MVDCRVKGGNCRKIIVNKPNLRVFSVKKTSFVDVFFNFIKCIFIIV